MYRTYRLHTWVAALLCVVTSSLVGCAGFSGPLIPSEPRTYRSSHDVNSTVDLNDIIETVRRAFTEEFGVPAVVTEGAMPAPLPRQPHPVMVDRRSMRLEGLGTVAIPRITCAGAVAKIHLLSTGAKGLGVAGGCILPYRDGTRIELVIHGSGTMERRMPALTGGTSHDSPSVLAALDRRLSKDLLGWRNVVTKTVPSVDVINPHDAGLAYPATRSAPAMESGGESTPVLVEVQPLTCFGPRGESIAIVDGPGSRTIVGSLHTELIVGRGEPSTAGYVHVHTDSGIDGWIKRTDLRWQACPIV